MTSDESVVPFLVRAAVVFALVATAIMVIWGGTDGAWTGAGCGLGFWMAGLYAYLKGV